MAKRPQLNETGERTALQFRTSAKVRERLEQAAQSSGRSLSQEMEMRLAQSLLVEDFAERAVSLAREQNETVVSMLGGFETFDLLRDMAWLIEGAESDLGQPWHSSGEGKARVYKILEAALPSLLSADRPSSIVADEVGRALRLMRHLPVRPQPAPVTATAESLRFVNEEELRDFFYLHADNAEPTKTGKAAKKV